MVKKERKIGTVSGRISPMERGDRLWDAWYRRYRELSKLSEEGYTHARYTGSQVVRPIPTMLREAKRRSGGVMGFARREEAEEAQAARDEKDKEPWEMTQREYIAYRERQTEGSVVPLGSIGLKKWHSQTGELHEAVVEAALRKGRPVPPEVLADYPDLKPKGKQKPKERITDRFMNEVILYGGIPMTRADVRRQAQEDTGDAKAADMFAFSSSARVAPEGVEPVSLAEFKQITEEEEPHAEERRHLSNKVDLHPDNESWATFLEDATLKEEHNGFRHYVSSNHHYIVDPDGYITTRVGFKGDWVFKEMSGYRPELQAVLDIEEYLLQRAAEGSLSAYSTTHFTPEQNKALKRMVRQGKILKVEMPLYSGPGNRYRYILPFPEKPEPKPKAELQAIHDSRSQYSRISDEQQTHALTIDPDDPRVEKWKRDQGSADVRGIDTPAKSKKTKRKRGKGKGKSKSTEVRGIQ